MQGEEAAWFCVVFQMRGDFDKVTSSCRCSDKAQVLHRTSHKMCTVLPRAERLSQLAEFSV